MLSFLWIGLILQLVRAEDECTPTPSGGFGTCRTCGAIINGKEYCSQCNGSGSFDSGCAPTDGVCTSDNNECAQKQDGVCTRCAYSSFMYKGGCYQSSRAPGNTVCETAQDGKCTTARVGYFVPPGADASHQSVIPCGDEEVVTIGSSKQYRGIPNCLTCTAPVNGDGADSTPKAPTCNACKDGFFVDASKESTCTACPANCLTCADGTAERCKSCTADTHFLGAADDGEGPCISCGDATQGSGAWRGVAGCAKCTKPQSAGPATCTECAADKHLKTDSGATSCVSAGECKDGFFPTTDSTGKRVCTTCGDTANGGIEDCAKCSLKAASAGAGPLVTCSECSSKKLSPLGDACLTACPAGTYPNDNGVCAPCHSSCVSCKNSSAEASCTACYPGSVLSRTSGDAGRCTPECTGEFVAHCAAGQCDGVVGGSKYCKKCDNGYVPINGICTAAGAAGRGASVC
ncbi:VSP, partial [Giardia lamblia P15]